MPLFILGGLLRENKSSRPVSDAIMAGGFALLAGLSLVIVVVARDYEHRYQERVVLRDYTATVIATADGGGKQLLVNGYGMTALTPVTKMMSHLPLAMLDRPPKKGLALCFGMGTSYRSMLSWGISATVVELVPSIPALLPFYHADGAEVLRSANGHIIVDDARRFLGRSNEKFDVIVVDPPPPVSAAATSLLYSVEFYQTAAKRLAPGGIFQQWIPLGPSGTDDPIVIASMAKALAASFPYIRVFGSFFGLGLHILASNQPFDVKSPAVLAAKLQTKAVADLVEWGPYKSAEEQFSDVLRQDATIQDLIAFFPTAPTMTDDRPINEYYLLRQMLKR
jgi:spermidine synthase